jgi:hypothetical protein
MSSLSIYLLTFALLLQTIYGATLTPLKHFCSSSENFTTGTNDPYKLNLRQLWGNLYFQTPPEGFGFGSVGEDPHKTYGLALCRGDLKDADCRTCINEATAESLIQCPHNKGAIIWYDHCLFKYNDTDFLGKIDNQNKFYTWSVRNVSDPTIFNQKTRELLSLLAKDASATPKLYAAGELELEKSKKVYGLAQCTRDISASDCSKCLDGIIGELPSCCDGKEGGRVFTGSCNIRYEIFSFVTA